MSNNCNNVPPIFYPYCPTPAFSFELPSARQSLTMFNPHTSQNIVKVKNSSEIELLNTIKKTNFVRKCHIDPATIVMPEGCLYQSKEDMEVGWRKLFNEFNIPSSANWDNVVKLLSNDPRYNDLKKFSQKKQIFHIYRNQKQKEEREENRIRIKNAKEKMKDIIVSHSRISSLTGFIDANRLLSNYYVWTSIPKDERRDLYDDLLPVMAKREKEIDSNLRKRNIIHLNEILNELPDLTFKTTWKDAKKALLKCPRFLHDDSLKDMKKLDALTCFEHHIMRLERTYEKVQKNEQNLMIRQYRKNREAFNFFLNELHKNCKLTSLSTWKELFPIISQDERFHRMVPQPGSSPLDLFKFFVFDLKSKFPEEKKIVKEIMTDLKVVVEINTDFESFCRILDEDSRFKLLDIGNVRMVFVSLIEKLDLNEKRKFETIESLKAQLFNLFKGDTSPRKSVTPFATEADIFHGSLRMANKTAHDSGEAVGKLSRSIKFSSDILFHSPCYNQDDKCESELHKKVRKRSKKKGRRRSVDKENIDGYFSPSIVKQK